MEAQATLPEAPPKPKKKRGGIPKGSPRPPLYDTDFRDAVRSLSMSGVPDQRILKQFPALNGNSLRQWRARDPIWQAAYTAHRGDNPTGRPTRLMRERRERQKAETAATQEVIISTIEASLPEISQGSKLRVALAADKSLKSFCKQPPKPKDWTQAGQVIKALKWATGEESAEGPQVQLNIWGNPGLSGTAVAPAFRDVGPSAQAEPAGEDTEDA